MNDYFSDIYTFENNLAWKRVIHPCNDTATRERERDLLIIVRLLSPVSGVALLLFGLLFAKSLLAFVIIVVL